jgi:hypothetical protein
MKLIISLVIILNLNAQNDSTICFTIEQSEQLLNDVNQSNYFEGLTHKQDSLILSMRSAKGTSQGLISAQTTQIKTLKETRLHYKKMFVKAERSRREFKDLLLSGLAGVGIGFILRDEKLGLLTGITSYGLMKFKILEIAL